MDLRDVLSRVGIDRAVIEAFCRANRIRRLALFGSVLRDDFTDASDIDVLVEFEAGATPGLRFFTLEQDLGRMLGRRVDLNTPGWIGRRLREQVLREAEVLFDAA